MMHVILNEEETCLYVMIKAELELIDIILQTKKSLQAQEKKLE